MLVLGVLLL